MSIREILKTEIRSLVIVMTYFLIGFGIIMLVMKLLLADYQIHTFLVGKAVFGALIAAKVVLISDHLPFMKHSAERPGWVTVLRTTGFYLAGAFVIVFGERIIEAWLHEGTLASALEQVSNEAELTRALATAICVSLLFAVYSAYDVLARSIGKERLHSAFFGKGT